MDEIHIIVDKEGNIDFTIKGIKGQKCEDIEKAISQILGKTIKSERTSEYYEKPVLIVKEVHH